MERRLKVAETFVCKLCEGSAKIVVRDDNSFRVHCPACGVSIDGDDASRMHDELRERYRRQAAQYFSRETLNRSRSRLGLSRIPLGKIENEISDPRWPFILKCEVID